MAAGTLGSLGSSITNYFHDCAVLLPFGVAAGGRNVMASFDITIIQPQGCKRAGSARDGGLGIGPLRRVRHTEPGSYAALHICALSRPERDDDRMNCHVHQAGGAPPNQLSSAVME